MSSEVRRADGFGIANYSMLRVQRSRLYVSQPDVDSREGQGGSAALSGRAVRASGYRNRAKGLASALPVCSLRAVAFDVFELRRLTLEVSGRRSSVAAEGTQRRSRWAVRLDRKVRSNLAERGKTAHLSIKGFVC